jgi:hypothetical protein
MWIRNDRAFFGIEIPLEEFESLAASHRQRVKRTAEVEAEGQRLLADDFPLSSVSNFVRNVCIWGDDPRISGRVRRRNTDTEIRSALSSAAMQLNASTPDVSQALAEVVTISGLGLSFGSKHLRFLSPKLCPVFDSFLSAMLPYGFHGRGYALFADDCQVLARELSQRGVPNPWPNRDGVWYAADAEAAVYELVRRKRSDAG